MPEPIPRPCLLFDLDGTLTDTDHLHFAAINRVLEPTGIQLDLAAFRTRVVGRPNSLIFGEFFPDRDISERERLAERKEVLAREGMAAGLTRLPGLTELLDWAEARNLPIGIVTNAPRANAETMLNGLALAERFGTLVIGDELAHGKPHPLPYLTGLERLDGDPDRSVAFEDSASGARAAVAAGLATVGITTSHSPAELVAVGCVLTIPDFADSALIPFLIRQLGLQP